MTERDGASARTIACPGCGAGMRSLDLERKPHGRVTVDVCPACRGLWFDAHESLQLTPQATLALLREVAASGTGPAPAQRSGSPPCPRCRTGLAATHDLQRTTRFTYWRCTSGHGRFTPFVQFMREKDYLRPLTPEEIAHVRAQIGTVRCSGCGAPVDLGRDAACRYCGARIEALDPEAVRHAIRRPPAPLPTPAASAEAAIDAWLAVRGPEREPVRHADLVVGGLTGFLGALVDRA